MAAACPLSGVAVVVFVQVVIGSWLLTLSLVGFRLVREFYGKKRSAAAHSTRSLDDVYEQLARPMHSLSRREFYPKTPTPGDTGGGSLTLRTPPDEPVK